MPYVGQFQKEKGSTNKSLVPQQKCSEDVIQNDDEEEFKGEDDMLMRSYRFINYDETEVDEGHDLQFKFKNLEDIKKADSFINVDGNDPI